MFPRLEAALLTRPPRLLHRLLPGAEWAGPGADAAGRPAVYLTFDDGPIPEQTPWVLAQLAQYQALATFFCVGENLLRHPEIALAALAAGHCLANHTQQHRSAWAQPAAAYLAGVTACQQVLDELVLAHEKAQLTPGAAGATGPLPPAAGVPGSPSPPAPPPAPAAGPKPLFRPPYGRLTRPLLAALRPGYRVVLWSLLTRDYDPALAPADCLRYALAAVQPGDIIVLHDSQKAAPRLRFVLPRLLEALAQRGYQFAAL